MYQIKVDGRCTGYFPNKNEAEKAYVKTVQPGKLVVMSKMTKAYVIKRGEEYGTTDSGYMYWSNNLENATLFKKKTHACLHVSNPDKEQILCVYL